MKRQDEHHRKKQTFNNNIKTKYKKSCSPTVEIALTHSLQASQ